MTIDQAEYRDLPTHLTRGAWVLLVYTLVSLGAVYATGAFADPNLFFVLFELPLLGIAAYVLSPAPRLRLRLPLFWSITAALVVGWRSGLGDSWMLALACWALVLTWMAMGVLEAIRRLDRVSGGRALGRFTSIIGAWMLAASFLFSWVGAWLRNPLEGSPPGDALLFLAEGVLATAEIRVVFGLVLMTGLMVTAASLFVRDPYEPPRPSDVRAITGDSVLGLLLRMIRWPVWIAVLVCGFTLKFFRHLVRAGQDFLDDWLARVYYAMVGLVLGPAILACGHLLVWTVAEMAMAPPGTAATGFPDQISRVATQHILGLLALGLYAASPAFVGLRWRDGEGLTGLWRRTREGFREVGQPAAISVGRGFSVLGVVVVVLPLAAMIPGGPGFGPTAVLYVILLGGGVAWYALERTL